MNRKDNRTDDIERYITAEILRNLLLGVIPGMLNSTVHNVSDLPFHFPSDSFLRSDVIPQRGSPITTTYLLFFILVYFVVNFQEKDFSGSKRHSLKQAHCSLLRRKREQLNLLLKCLI